MISKEDVQNLANLARIEVTDEETESIRQKMEGILDYVSEIQSLSGDIESGGFPDIGENHNVLREDINPHEAGVYTDTIIANAPEKEGMYVKVRKIL